MATRGFNYRQTPPNAKQKEIHTEGNIEMTQTPTNELEKSLPRGDRPKRRKVYERIREANIPAEIHELFAKNDYDLRLVRWAINGEEDYRHLARREREGYEFVKTTELPEWYLSSLQIVGTKSRQGLVTTGDLCLMKIDTDLRNSRREVYARDAQAQIDAVDIHVLEKKGFRNLGSKSKVFMKEPSFQD